MKLTTVSITYFWEKQKNKTNFGKRSSLLFGQPKGLSTNFNSLISLKRNLVELSLAA